MYRFPIKQIVLIPMIGVLMFLADLFIAAPITATTGISGTGGVFSTLFWVLFASLGGLIIKKFPAITLMHFVYGFLTILAPITLLPGILKLVVFLLMGLLTEVIIMVSQYKKWGYYLGFFVGHLFFFFGTFLLYILLGIPTISQVGNAKYLMVLIPLLTFLSTQIGVFLSFKIFNKLKNKSIVKQIQC